MNRNWDEPERTELKTNSLTVRCLRTEANREHHELRISFTRTRGLTALAAATALLCFLAQRLTEALS